MTSDRCNGPSAADVARRALDRTAGRAPGHVQRHAQPSPGSSAAIERDQNAIADYDIERALRLVTLKLVGYTEVIHALLPRIERDGSVVVVGGLAKDRPYPGSLAVSTVNGGMVGLVAS